MVVKRRLFVVLCRPWARIVPSRHKSVTQVLHMVRYAYRWYGVSSAGTNVKTWCVMEWQQMRCQNECMKIARQILSERKCDVSHQTWAHTQHGWTQMCVCMNRVNVASVTSFEISWHVTGRDYGRECHSQNVCERLWHGTSITRVKQAGGRGCKSARKWWWLGTCVTWVKQQDDIMSTTEGGWHSDVDGERERVVDGQGVLTVRLICPDAWAARSMHCFGR